MSGGSLLPHPPGLTPGGDRPRRPARQIVADAAKDLGVPYADLFTRTRREPVVRARWTALAALYAERPTWSMTRLGREVGLASKSADHALVAMGLLDRAARGAARRAETRARNQAVRTDERRQQLRQTADRVARLIQGLRPKPSGDQPC